MEYKYTPKTKEELISAIEKEIDLQGDDADLNCIDTSAITDMSNLFGLRYGFCCFEGDVSKWNVMICLACSLKTNISMEIYPNWRSPT